MKTKNLRWENTLIENRLNGFTCPFSFALLSLLQTGRQCCSPSVFCKSWRVKNIQCALTITLTFSLKPKAKNHCSKKREEDKKKKIEIDDLLRKVNIGRLNMHSLQTKLFQASWELVSAELLSCPFDAYFYSFLTWNWFKIHESLSSTRMSREAEWKGAQIRFHLERNRSTWRGQSYKILHLFSGPSQKDKYAFF